MSPTNNQDTIFGAFPNRTTIRNIPRRSNIDSINTPQLPTLKFKIDSQSKRITNLQYSPAYAQLHGNDNFTTVQTHIWTKGISNNGNAPTNRYAQIQEKRQLQHHSSPHLDQGHIK